jgi:hypothetical protein
VFYHVHHVAFGAFGPFRHGCFLSRPNRSPAADVLVNRLCVLVDPNEWRARCVTAKAKSQKRAAGPV